MNNTKNSYASYRFPTEIISYAVWLYFCFTLSYRDVEDFLAARSSVVTYETVRQWCWKVWPGFRQRRQRATPPRQPRQGAIGGIWASFISVNGRRNHLQRAVDQGGCVLDILIQPRREMRAVKSLRLGPQVIVTDKLKSYGAARKEFIAGIERYQHRVLNNRAELSHQPTRQRERLIRRVFSLPMA